MINNKRVLALVPARSGSKGLPGKNIRELCGKPLIAWSIEQGLACEYVDTVVVSTDSQETADIAERYGARVPFLRPAELAVDTASTVEVVLHAVDFLEGLGDPYDYVALLEPTSPLRDVADITGALKLLDEGVGESIVSVAAAEGAHPAFLFRLHQGRLRPMSGSQPTGLRRQDLEQEFFYLEGSIYVTSVGALRKHKTFYHSSTAPWIVDRYKAIEIDALSDFISVDALMRAKREGVLR